MLPLSLNKTVSELLPGALNKHPLSMLSTENFMRFLVHEFTTGQMLVIANVIHSQWPMYRHGLQEVAPGSDSREKT